MLSTEPDCRNLVGGELLAPAGPAIPVASPWTGERIAEAACAGPEAVDGAVQAARAGLDAWAATTPKDRSERLLAIAAAVEASADELAVLESLDVGKPVAWARDEIPVCVDVLRYFSGAARVLDGAASTEYVAGSTSVLRREPIGVVGLITPWNYPLLEAVWKIAPALAAGNACVLKPSELTPLTTLAVARLTRDLLPAGVLNVITGDGRPTGEAIVRHAGVAMVSMTGDVATGRAVAATAAETLTRVHLELGGKAPAIVLEDADCETVADHIAVAGFVNGGQDCTAACRLIVADAVHDELLDALVARVRGLRLAEAADDPEGDLGPLVSHRQRERVAGFVARARRAGARVLTGGRAADRPGFFFEPTVVAGVAQDSEIVQNEVFGPVVTVQRAASFEQAIAFANDVRYGLASSIWTNDLARATAASRRLEFGTVWVNDHLPTPSEMPFGGFGASGYGKELSTEALREYTRTKHVMTTAR